MRVSVSRACAIVAGVLLGVYQVHALYVRPIGATANGPTEAGSLVELRGGATIGQEIRVGAQGLSTITVFPAPLQASTNALAPPSPEATAGGGGDGRVVFALHGLPEEYPRAQTPVVALAREELPLARVLEGEAFDWRFPPVPSSRGRIVRLEISVPADSQATFALRTTVEDGHRDAAFTVDGREQWGDLAFATTTTGDTAASNAALNANAYVGSMGWLAVLVAVAGVNALMAGAWWLLGREVEPRAARATAPSSRASTADTTWLLPPMDRTTVALAVAVLAATAGVVRSMGPEVDRLEDGAFDLLAAFPVAEKRTTMGSVHEAFELADVTIDGVRRSSLLALPFSRVTWTVDVPPAAVLRTAIAFRPDAWTREGDGATFRVGVSDGQRYEEVYRRYLAPYASAGDRRWYNIEADLSGFAGSRVSVIFNTEPGELGNAVNDAAVWGAPRIVAGAARATGKPAARP